MAREIVSSPAATRASPPTACAGPRRRPSRPRSDRAFAALDCTIVRGHPCDPAAQHGFLDSQIRGIEAFRPIDPTVPLVVAEAVWQYTSHVLPGLTKHNAARSSRWRTGAGSGRAWSAC